MCAAKALTAIWIGRGGAGKMVRKYQTKQTFIYLTIQISSLLFSQLLQLWLNRNLKNPVPPGEKSLLDKLDDDENIFEDYPSLKDGESAAETKDEV